MRTNKPIQITLTSPGDYTLDVKITENTPPVVRPLVLPETDKLEVKPIMTDNEFAVYEMLVGRLTVDATGRPTGYYVLPQVPFSSLLRSVDPSDVISRHIRNALAYYVVDFVVINNRQDICCLIELDDPYHFYEEQQEKDRSRDALFTSLGIPTYRMPYKNSEQLRLWLETVQDECTDFDELPLEEQERGDIRPPFGTCKTCGNILVPRLSRRDNQTSYGGCIRCSEGKPLFTPLSIDD